MTHEEAMAGTLPIAQDVWKAMVPYLHGDEPKHLSAFAAMHSAMAALYSLGFDIGAAHARIRGAE